MNLTNFKELPISFTINKVYENKDTRFMSITIDVLHTGLNLNGSIFEKDVVNNYVDTIKNTPILGYIEVNSKDIEDFTEHKYKVVKRNGDYHYLYTGSAYGVIPESCNPRWVKKVSSDGKLREYLQCDALIWSKFESAVNIFKRDKIKNQSMELDENKLIGVENDDGTFTFSEFAFDGCCILSTTDESIQPAMIDSIAVSNFSIDTISNDIKQKLNEYNSILNNPSIIDVNIYNYSINSNEEGGNIDLDEKLKILTEFNLKTEDLNFSIDEISEEDLRIKCSEFKSELEKETLFIHPKFSTYKQKRESLSNALDPIIVKNSDGDIVESTYFYVNDFDDNYVLVEKNYYSDDDYQCDYGRFSYEFDETTLTATITSSFEKMVQTWLTEEEYQKLQDEQSDLRGKLEALLEEYNSYKNEYTVKDSEVAEFEELKEYKAKKELEEFNTSKDELFNQFSELNESKEFIEFQENTGELTLEEIETTLFTMLGRKNKKDFKSTRKSVVSTIKVPVMHTEVQTGFIDSYDDLVKKYTNGGK